MKAIHLLLGVVLGTIMAVALIVGAILVLVATGSLWLMGAFYCAGTVGFVLVGIGLAKYIDQR